MKTISFNKTGEPGEVLQLVEKATPVPDDNEVLVKMLGSPINPADGFFIKGIYRFPPQFPQQTAGLEGAGIVVEAGKYAEINPGSLIAFFNRNSWAEYALVPKDEAVVLPPEFPLDKAVQFCINPFTAWGLLEESNAKPGEWILLTAANSMVSRITIQMAKQRDLHVIAAVRDLRQTEELITLGADAVVNIGDEDFTGKLKDITNGKGVNVALDPVGGKTGSDIFQSMAPFGRIIIYGDITRDPVQFFNATATYKNLTIKGFGVRAFLTNQAKQQRLIMIRRLTEELAHPSFKMPVAGKFKWQQFRQAIAATIDTDKQGKIIFAGEF